MALQSELNRDDGWLYHARGAIVCSEIAERLTSRNQPTVHDCQLFSD
jgi:hypothetical protein